MLWKYLGAFTLVVCATIFAPGFAATVTLHPSDPRLERLIGEALSTNPDIVVARSQTEALELRVVPARTLPDPFLSTTLQNDGNGLSLGTAEGSYLSPMFSQPLPWPGKLALTGRIAESEAREARVGSFSRASRTIEAAVRRAYYDLALAEAISRLIDDRQQSWRDIEAVVRARYEVGLAVQQDLLRARAEILRLEEQRAETAALMLSRTAELNRLTGHAQDDRVETVEMLPAALAPIQLPELLAFVMEKSPELAGARQSVGTSRLRVDLAKKAFRPDFVVNGGPMYRGSLDPMWQVGVGVSLPIYAKSRQAYQLREAEVLTKGSEAQIEAIHRELELRTRERYAALVASERVSRLYGEGLLPVDQLSYESALASYQTGKVPFITVLDAQNALFSDRATYLQKLAESLKWRIALDEASLQQDAMPSGGSSEGAMSSVTSSKNMNQTKRASASGANAGMR